MDVITESALRILVPRRNLHGVQRLTTRALIHDSIVQLRCWRLRSNDHR
jgi:hypothetical protein